MENLLIIVAILIIVAVAMKYSESKQKKAHQQLLADLGEFSWSGAKDALAKLIEIRNHVDSNQVRDVARHYLTVWCGDLMSHKATSVKEALSAKARFEKEIAEIKKISKMFGLSHIEICPFSTEEMSVAHLKCHVSVLEQSLEHYPEKAWMEITPGQIFEALITYADITYTNRQIEKWRSWIRSAYLKQARREIRRIKRGEYSRSTRETNLAVDKILDLLSKAKAQPEEIEITLSEIEDLRKTAKYA